MSFLSKAPSATVFKKIVILILGFLFSADLVFAQQYRKTLELKDWWFANKEIPDATDDITTSGGWAKVSVPHDWAIKGPFSKGNDQQEVKVTEDGEVKEKIRVGRTAGLPFFGIGWYKRILPISKSDKNKRIFIEFDGAMSNSKVFLNGKYVGEWPYGYSSFSFDLTPFVKWHGPNILGVRLENFERSSRWYPGAGIYRSVRLVKTNPIHVRHWGTTVTTSIVSPKKAVINIRTQVSNDFKKNRHIKIENEIYDYNRHKAGAMSSATTILDSATIPQQIVLRYPALWSAERPKTYRLKTTISSGKKILDVYYTTFGVRNIEFSANEGMIVNGVKTKLKGVCLHDDLGALGMAFNKAALRHHLLLLKEMGCNAIRGTHNPHAPEMLELCDEMGFYYVDEAFDEWKIPKMENGYHKLFDKWAKKDLQAMIERDRNHPALIMYSIGNEIKEATTDDGADVAKHLVDICKTTDPTRPVTAGINVLDPAVKYGFANTLDVTGWNYKPNYYTYIHQLLPNKPMYGSETASTISSRGVYHFPVASSSMKTWPDNQASSYDLEYCSWSQLPDVEWQSQDKNDFVAGEFVWTGTDYLGEPSPYNDNWPSRSSYFGLIDLAGIPKDRYYLYQSRWSSQKVLHVLPHWNWAGKEGQPVPIYVYTNYPVAEVFINGVSFGKKSFNKKETLDCYRLRWENTIYQPGELKVIAYDKRGRITAVQKINTALAPARIILKADRKNLKADNKDLSYVTVSIVDKYGNLCPNADNLVHVNVLGAAYLRAVDNGNPATTESFQVSYRKAFHGKMMAIVQSLNKNGVIRIKASAKGLQGAEINISAR